MTEYNVKWEIELDASSPEEAAKFALAIHRDPESTATVFEVKDTALTNPLIFIIDTRALPEKKLDLSTVPIDAKVIVWDNAGSQIKHRRHFAGVDIHGKAMTWYQGQSSWTQSGFAKTSWDHCILEEEEEATAGCTGEADIKPYAPELSMLDCATVGDNFDADPNGSATAGIHLPNHGNAIEVYAETTPKAIALRDAILKRIRREYD